MNIRNSSDLLAAALFLALGLFALLYSIAHYTLGTPARMGAGFFPVLVGCGLILLGVILLLQAIFDADDAVGRINLRVVLLIVAGTLLFGLLIEHAGLLIASATLVVAARAADRGFSLVETTGLAALLFALTAALFRYGLGMPLHLLPF